MPAEYVECKKEYMARGLSERAASALCAALYYKKHGKTVKEAAEEEGETFAADYDETIYNNIVSNMIDSATPSVAETTLQTETFSSAVIDLDDGVFEIIATKDGAASFSSDGYVLTWPKETLQMMAGSWSGSPVTANHERKKRYGRILASWFDGDKVRQLIKVNDEMAGWIRRNISHVGVSIEAGNIKHENGRITDAVGTGVTIVFPPHTAMCTKEEGCGVVASDVDGAKLTYEERKKLPDSAFCGPDRSFPAHDAAHVRNGLARLPQSKFSAEEKRRIFNCLKERAKKYGIDVDETESSTPVPSDGGNNMLEQTATVMSADASNEISSDALRASALEKELEEARKRLSELETFKRDVITKEMERNISIIASFIDPAPFKDSHPCVVKAVASALEEYKRKLDSAPLVGSGVKVRSSDVEKPSIPAGFSSEDEYKEFMEANKRLKTYTGREIKVS